jgi:hypothetical protein
MMVAMAALLRVTLPVSRPDARIGYRELLSSLISLARKLPALRPAAIMSGFAFGAFSAYWTTLVFLLEKPPYHYGAQMARSLGLAGVAGTLAAPVVGWLSDRGYPRIASGCVDREDRVWLAVSVCSWTKHEATRRMDGRLTCAVVTGPPPASPGPPAVDLVQFGLVPYLFSHISQSDADVDLETAYTPLSQVTYRPCTTRQ